MLQNLLCPSGAANPGLRSPIEKRTLGQLMKFPHPDRKAFTFIRRLAVVSTISIPASPARDEHMKAAAERVQEISERFTALKQRLYLGQAGGLVENALADVREATGLTVPEPLFSQAPWRNSRR